MLLLVNLSKHNIRFYNNGFEYNITEGNNRLTPWMPKSSDVVLPDTSHIAGFVPSNADHVAVKPVQCTNV